MASWTTPPLIKVFEALGALADGRLQAAGRDYIVLSSERDKAYTVIVRLDMNQIHSNDNGSFWIGYVGYPAIAVLMFEGHLPYDPEVAALVADIPWKRLNTSYGNNYDRTIAHITNRLDPNDQVRLLTLVTSISETLGCMPLSPIPGLRSTPPAER